MYDCIFNVECLAEVLSLSQGKKAVKHSNSLFAICNSTLLHTHPEFTRIVFHGLRHSSATYQLMISGGDIKSVQGTTGHASADLLVNTYAHIQQSSRMELGKKFENSFYAKPEASAQTPPVQGNTALSMAALLELLKDADPETKAQLRLALLT